MKFNDLDADGLPREAGEPGLSGWTIYVDYDDDGVKDAGEPSDVTDGSGNYTITGINPGTWKVKEVAQTDWTCSYPNPCHHQEAFQSGGALTGNDFGNWIAPECVAGERLTSVTLLLVSANPDPIDIVVHDQNGKNPPPLATFPDSEPGDILIVEPAGGATFFESQNLRFSLEGELSKNLKVHLSCSDYPEIGDQHSGNAKSNSATLEKTFFQATEWN